MTTRLACIGLLTIAMAPHTPVVRGESNAATPVVAEGADATSVVRRLGSVMASPIPDEDDRLGELARSGNRSHPEDDMWRLAWVLSEAYSGRSTGALSAAEELVEALPLEPGRPRGPRP
jgi:hypothetical protein